MEQTTNNLFSTASKIQYEQANSINKQKIFFTLFQTLAFYAYAILCFFKQPTGDSKYLVTLTIGVIPIMTYSIIQTILIILLCFFKFRGSNNFIKKNVCLLLSTIFITQQIYFWFTHDYQFTGLIIRPFFLIFYSKPVFKAMKKYIKITCLCLQYFGFMWFMLFVFACLGIQLFGDITLPDNNYNFFNDLQDALYQILIMQTTANYPDVGLPYVAYKKPAAIFFVAIMIVHTMLIGNIIMSVNYNSFKNLSDEEENSESILILIYNVISIKLNKQQQEEVIKSLSERNKLILKWLDWQPYHFVIWVYNMILLFIICLNLPNENIEYQAIAIVCMNIVTIVDRVIKLTIYRYKFWRNYWFQLVQIILSLFSLILYVVVAFNSNDHSAFSSLILMQLPRIISFILRYMILFTETAVRFFKKFREIGRMIFIISLIFAAIGQILFGGLNTMEKKELLAASGNNPLYVHVNFNNTLNSFYTLFSLLIVNNWNAITNTYVFLTGTRNSRFFFVCYYCLVVQIAYSLILALMIEHIISETQRFKTKVKSINKPQTYQQQLQYHHEMIKILRQLIQKLKKSYRKDHNQLYQVETPLSSTQNYPQLIIQTQIKNKKNVFSLIYFKDNQSSQCVFEAMTIIDKSYTGQINVRLIQLNNYMNELKEMNQKWEIISVRDLFIKKNIPLQHKLKFEHSINFKLRKHKLKFELDFNKVRTLVDYYLKDKENKEIYYVMYDLPKNYCRNICDLYIEGKRVGTSFLYEIYGQLALIEKIKMNEISRAFSKKVLGSKTGISIN